MIAFYSQTEREDVEEDVAGEFDIPVVRRHEYFHVGVSLITVNQNTCPRCLLFVPVIRGSLT